MEKDTVLAFSNGHQRAIIIEARVKRAAFQYLLRRGKSRKMAYLHIFSAGLFILLEPALATIILRGNHIVIDPEYTNQDSKIKGMLLRHIGNAGFRLPKEYIFFEQIGRKSTAHNVAYAVQQGNRKSDQYVSIEELMDLL